MNDLTPMLAIMVPIIATVGAYIMVVYLRKYQNAERMSMIEKGISPEIFQKTRRYGSSASLRASLLLIGGGLGLLMGYFLDRMFYMEEVGYFSMLLILGGAGLGAAYVIEEKKNKNDA